MVNTTQAVAVVSLCLVPVLALPTTNHNFTEPSTNNNNNTNHTLSRRHTHIPDFPLNTYMPTVYCEVDYKAVMTVVDIYFKYFHSEPDDDIRVNNGGLVNLLDVWCYGTHFRWDDGGKEQGWDHHLHFRQSWNHGGDCTAQQIIKAGIPNPAPIEMGMPWKRFCHGHQ